jgi:hypothetical protein
MPVFGAGEAEASTVQKGFQPCWRRRRLVRRPISRPATPAPNSAKSAGSGTGVPPLLVEVVVPPVEVVVPPVEVVVPPVDVVVPPVEVVVPPVEVVVPPVELQPPEESQPADAGVATVKAKAAAEARTAIRSLDISEPLLIKVKTGVTHRAFQSASSLPIRAEAPIHAHHNG